MTASDEARTRHRWAKVYWWVVLLGTIVLSVAHNRAHAYLAAPDGQAATAANVASVPPVLFAAIVEGTAILVRRGVSGAVYRAFLAGAALIGAGAFAVSFAAIREFAGTLRIFPGVLGWVYPAVLDLTMALATVALVALGDKPVKKVKAAKPAADAAPHRRWIGLRETARRAWHGTPDAAQTTAPAASPVPQTAASAAASAAVAPVQHVSPQVSEVRHAAVQHPTQHDASRGTTLMPQPAPQDVAPARAASPQDAAPQGASPAAAMQHITPDAAHRAAAQRVVAAAEDAGHPADRIATVLTMKDAGLSARKIAETTGVDARRVGVWVRTAEQQPEEHHPDPHPAVESSGQPAVERVLTRVG